MSSAARTLRSWSLGEEIAHSVSHGVGVVLAIVGLTTLVALATLRGDVWHVTSTAVFGSSLVLLYVASTLYHAIPQPRAKRVLRVLDHSAIYLAIAGTYTPFALGPLRGPSGWALLAFVWIGALGGIVFKSVALERAPVISVVIYALLGWSVLFVLDELFARVPPAGIFLLFAGGICYTVGIAFYAWHRLRFNHFVWHLFVLAGSGCHVCAALWPALG